MLKRTADLVYYSSRVDELGIPRLRSEFAFNARSLISHYLGTSDNSSNCQYSFATSPQIYIFTLIFEYSNSAIWGLEESMRRFSADFSSQLGSRQSSKSTLSEPNSVPLDNLHRLSTICSRSQMLNSQKSRRLIILPTTPKISTACLSLTNSFSLCLIFNWRDKPLNGNDRITGT
jgi:hypothetical protein